MMKLHLDFSALHQLAQKIGAPSVQFGIDADPRDFDPIVIGDGREVPITEVSTAGGLLSYKGRQVVLYIKDHSHNFDRVVAQPSEGNKFHLAHCSTLAEMIDKKRYERYVVKNSVDRLFTISSTRPQERQTQVKLHVCKNCLNTLNYQGYKTQGARRTEIVDEFDLQRFFATFTSCFRHSPSGVKHESALYTTDWAALSLPIRQSSQFCCADCGVNCSSHSYLSHVRHKNRVLTDNNPDNLEVLCADCCRKSQPQFMRVTQKEMRTIQQLRADQGLFAISSWADVLRLCDPALYGDAHELRDRGWPPPVLHYAVQNSHNKTVILDMAWPQQKKALSLWPVGMIPQWQIFGFRQIKLPKQTVDRI